MKGLYVVLEGPDGTGKSTTMPLIAELLKTKLPNREIIQTAHPGMTPLGKIARQIIKNPEAIGQPLDPLSAQLLMVIDHINFRQQILRPALDREAIVLADRSNLVSGVVYGLATGVGVDELTAIMKLTRNPQIDLLFLLNCGQRDADLRLADRKKDYFESKGKQFWARIASGYSSVAMGISDQAKLVGQAVAVNNITCLSTSEFDSNTIAGTIADTIVAKAEWRSRQ